MKHLPWFVAAVGGWLIAVPFLLNEAGTDMATQNGVGVGLVMVVSALVWGFSKWVWQ
jgi:hypothetical protein